MNFQDIRPVPTHKDLLDRVLGSARTKLSAKSIKGKKIDIMRSKETMRINIIMDKMNSELEDIGMDFPSFDKLSEFYQRLVRAQTDYVRLKKSLGSLKWAREKVKEIGKAYSRKISGCQTVGQLTKFRSALVGRIASVINQISSNLKYLHEVRAILRTFPDIKEGMKTVALYGFPNVGKTTILSKITKSKPKIANYAFTTKSLNIGYIELPTKKVQLIDTPGTLNRDKMNPIELQADIALETVADEIVVVIDPTDTYSQEDQQKLLKRARNTKKKVYIYVSKTDIAKNTIKNAITNPEELKKKLILE